MTDGERRGGSGERKRKGTIQFIFIVITFRIKERYGHSKMRENYDQKCTINERKYFTRQGNVYTVNILHTQSLQ